MPSPSRLAAARKLSLQPCDLRAQLPGLRPPCANFAHTAHTARTAASDNPQPFFPAPMA